MSISRANVASGRVEVEHSISPLPNLALAGVPFALQGKGTRARVSQV